MLSLGSSRSHSSSQEQGTSFGMSDASSFDLSESQNSADSSSSSFGVGSSYGQNISRSSVFGADVFGTLFSDASNVAANVARNAGNLTGAANGLFDSGMSFLGELGGLAGEGPAGAGEDYLVGRINGGGDDILNGQIASIKGDLETFFGESILPQIRRDSIAAGAFGGDRGELATGVASRGLLSEFAKQVTALRSNDQLARDNAASTLAGVQAQRRLAAASSGVAALPGQLGILEGGNMLALSPYLALSDILGDPAILTQSDAFNTSSDQSGSTSSSTSSGSSRSVGGSQSTSREGSQYSSSSSSKSKSWNFGLGS